MGRRGPLPKEEGRAQGHRQRKQPAGVSTSAAVLRQVAVPDVPEAPEGLLESTLESWRVYWRSDVAQATTEAGRPTVRRLFELYDQRERAMEIVKQTLVVRGSKDQLRLNPVADLVTKLETIILRLETELGLTPMSRARLGIATGQAQLTLEEINERFREDKKPRRRKDPRLQPVPAADER
jgi:P27 family predicted phage terminase small subunit